MSEQEKPKEDPPIKEGEYYFEDGLMVLKASYLKRRGYCCNNGCRHCPYDKNQES